MTKEQDKRWVNLRILGAVELGLYIALASALALTQQDEMFITNQLVQMYFWAALTLVPSTIIFISSPRHQKVDLVLIARRLQKALFIAVCFAFLPSIFLAQYQPALLTSTFLGLIAFPVMSSLVKAVLPETPESPAPAGEASVTTVQQPAAEKVQPVTTATKFCPKCGSQIGADGKCPSCA
jgi:hypothetical protein